VGGLNLFAVAGRRVRKQAGFGKHLTNRGENVELNAAVQAAVGGYLQEK